jgi:hypothetical protein
MPQDVRIKLNFMKNISIIILTLFICNLTFCSQIRTSGLKASPPELKCDRFLLLADTLYSYLSKPDTLLIFVSYSNWKGNDQVRFMSKYKNIQQSGYCITADNITKYLLSKNIQKNISPKVKVQIAHESDAVYDFSKSIEVFSQHNCINDVSDKNVDDGTYYAVIMKIKEKIYQRCLYEPKITERSCTSLNTFFGLRTYFDKNLSEYKSVQNNYLKSLL